MKEHTIAHIAIIPDGNRRWATSQGKPAIAGHRYAVEHTLPALYNELLRLKIPYCTFWALSPENFTKRSRFEIKHLLFLITHFMQAHLQDMHAKNIRIRTIGDLTVLPDDVIHMINESIQKTKDNTGMTFTFGINYGGRDELVRAFKKLIETHGTITQEEIGSVLYTSGMPDPDMIIRTGGEMRTSGFLIWQSPYAEYIFRDVLFPDFTPKLLHECIAEFHSRKRRFGA